MKYSIYIAAKFLIELMIFKYVLVLLFNTPVFMQSKIWNIKGDPFVFVKIWPVFVLKK